MTIRLWQERGGDGEPEWRGTVKLVLTGERRHFRDLGTLVDHIMALLESDNLPGSDVLTH